MPPVGPRAFRTIPSVRSREGQRRAPPSRLAPAPSLYGAGAAGVLAECAPASPLLPAPRGPSLRRLPPRPCLRHRAYRPPCRSARAAVPAGRLLGDARRLGSRLLGGIAQTNSTATISLPLWGRAGWGLSPGCRRRHRLARPLVRCGQGGGPGGDRDPGPPSQSHGVWRRRAGTGLHHLCRRRDRPRPGPGAGLLPGGAAPQRRRPGCLHRRLGRVRRGGHAGRPPGGVVLRSSGDQRDVSGALPRAARPGDRTGPGCAAAQEPAFPPAHDCRTEPRPGAGGRLRRSRCFRIRALGHHRRLPGRLHRVERAALGRGLLSPGLRVQAIYGVGAGVGLAMAAPMIVHVVFGPAWEPAVVPLVALALYAAFRSLGLGPHEAFRGIGRPDLLVRLSLLRLAVVAPALLIGARFGIDGVAWAQAAAALPLALVMQVVASHVLGIPLSRIRQALQPALAVALGVAVAMAPVRFLVVGPEPVRLAFAIVAGAAGAALAVALTDRRMAIQLKRLVINGSHVRLAMGAE